MPADIEGFFVRWWFALMGSMVSPDGKHPLNCICMYRLMNASCSLTHLAFTPPLKRQNHCMLVIYFFCQCDKMPNGSNLRPDLF